MTIDHATLARRIRVGVYKLYRLSDSAVDEMKDAGVSCVRHIADVLIRQNVKL